MSDQPSSSNSLLQFLDGPKSPQHLEQQARGLFSQFVSAMGQAEAIRLWACIPEKKRGRPKNSKAKFTPELMDLFAKVQKWEAFQGKAPGAVARSLGEMLNNQYPFEFGASAESIRKKILTEVKQRREAKERAATWAAGLDALATNKPNALLQYADFPAREEN